MLIRNNQGEAVGEINHSVTQDGDHIVTNTLYDRGTPVVQKISIRDNQGKIWTTNIIGGKVLP